MLFAALLLFSGAAPAHAEKQPPYWVSLRVDKANVRVGPSGNYRIAWIYQRRNLPLKVTRRLSGWRLVEDHDGDRGWIVARFLSEERTALVIGDDLAEMRAGPSDGAELSWRAEPGVVGALGECREGWCEFTVDERVGWVRETLLWGVGAP